MDNDSNNKSYDLTGRDPSMAVKLISDNEVKAIDALTCWVANEQRVHKETIVAIFQAEFNVIQFKELKIIDLDDTIKFLVDLRVNAVMH